MQEPPETGGLRGVFDPPDESAWEAHGRGLLDVMLGCTDMLPCAEDLGVIPLCSYRVLEEYHIVGMDVQRWNRDWEKTYRFKAPEDYRLHSLAVISTHDMSILRAWWENEAGTVDEVAFRQKCPSRGLATDEIIGRLFDLDRSRRGRLAWKPEVSTLDILLWELQRPADQVKDFIDLYLGSFREKEQFWEYLGLPGSPTGFTSEFALAALKRINQSASVFSIQLLQDWLAPTPAFNGFDPWDLRYNSPGSFSDRNWSLVMPFSLETLLAGLVQRAVRSIVRASGRCSDSPAPNETREEGKRGG
jgi:4-alpha-glucanotransferase